MLLGSPIDALSQALGHAAHVAFPDIHRTVPDRAAMSDWPAKQRIAAIEAGTAPTIPKVSRPTPADCVVFAMFPQTWGSTALGFGGLGGAAITPAYTVVIKGPSGHIAVYWAGQFAYILDPGTMTAEQQANLKQDLAEQSTASRSEAKHRYGVVF